MVERVLNTQSAPNRVFILGSGFSKQLTGGKFPTEQELLGNLKGEIKDENLIKHIQGETDHIEKILSRIELDNKISPEDKEALKQKIYDNFQRQLSVSVLYGSKEADQIRETARDLVGKLFHPGDVLILMNWDILTEHLLCINANPTVDPDHLRKPFNYGPLTSMVNSTFMSPEGTLLGSPTNNITILKPHGSFNFYPLKGENQMYALMNTSHRTFYDSTLDLFSNGRLFPGYGNIRLRVNGSGDLSTKIVLPTFVKSIENQTFAKLWMYSSKALLAASKLIVIGYSFPMEDGLMMQTLHNGLWREETEQKRQGYNRDLPIYWLNSELEIDKFINSTPVPIFNSPRSNLKRYTPENFGNFNNAYEELLKDLDKE